MAGLDPMTFAMISGAATSVKSMQSQKKASSIAMQQQNLQNQRIQIKDAAEKRKRQQLLKRQSATQRARFSGLGIGAGGGSSDAVLEGLRTRSNADARDKAALDALSRSEKDLNANANLLSKKSKAFKSNLDLLIGKK